MLLLGLVFALAAESTLRAQTPGPDWVRVTEHAPWQARDSQGEVAFGGKLWLYGGLLADGSVNGDLWSSADGAAWQKVASVDVLGGGPGARQRAILGSPDGNSLYLFGV